MDIDKTTLADLSMFNNGEDISVFGNLDLCSTSTWQRTVEELISAQR